MKMWLIVDKIDPRRTAIVGPGTEAQAVKRFDAERLQVTELKGVEILRARDQGIEFFELDVKLSNHSDIESDLM